MEKRIKYYNPKFNKWLDVTFDRIIFNKIIAAAMQGYEVQHLTTYMRRL